MKNSLVDYICMYPWAITPEALRGIIDIAQRTVSNPIDPETFHIREPNSLLETENESKSIKDSRLIIRENSAIIPVHGPIFPRANLFTYISEAESLTGLINSLNSALNDASIENIIFDIDSPGGSTIDLDEFAEAVFNAQAQKPIIAFISGLGASAAYWIASSASEIIAGKGAIIGSIGTVAAIRDESEKDKKEGIQNINIVSNISPMKRPDYTTAEGRSGLQKIVDDLGSMFAETVARNRGTDFKDVINNYGKGDIMGAADALKVGMIDNIDSLENVIKRQSQKTNSTTGVKTMDTLLKNATAETLKAENPALFDAVIAQGKASANPDIEAAKTEAFTAGVKAENQRIQDCESLDDGQNTELISKNKFNSECSKGDLAIMITESNKAKTEAAGKAIEDDAEDLEGQSAEAGGAGEPGSEKAEKAQATAKGIAAGMPGRHHQ